MKTLSMIDKLLKAVHLPAMRVVREASQVCTERLPVEEPKPDTAKEIVTTIEPESTVTLSRSSIITMRAVDAGRPPKGLT